MKQDFGDQEILNKMHTDDAIMSRMKASIEQSYVGDFILGAIDGLVTTFAVVASVAGAGLRAEYALVLGLANLLADGFSMAAGNYLKSKADKEVLDRFRQMEEQHIDLVPEGEREEIRQIYREKGFKGKTLEEVVSVITADRKRWVDEMLVGEWGLQLEQPSPFWSGLWTMVAFISVGFIPLVTFVFYVGRAISTEAFIYSSLLTLVAFFCIGYIKGVVLEQPRFKGGLESLLIGGLAAAMAYGVGYFAKVVFGL
jgi:VIT1/CCC1 family predicted Fe2+/Mn2+ transporter